MKIILMLIFTISIAYAQHDDPLDECKEAFIMARIKLDSVRSDNTKKDKQLTELAKSNAYLVKAHEQDSIGIAAKEEQIKKMEGIKIPVIASSNPDWWKFALGGGVVGALVYYIFDKVVFK